MIATGCFFFAIAMWDGGCLEREPRDGSGDLLACTVSAARGLVAGLSAKTAPRDAGKGLGLTTNGRQGDVPGNYN